MPYYFSGMSPRAIQVSNILTARRVIIKLDAKTPALLPVPKETIHKILNKLEIPNAM